jgi:HEPN domain-containing protein
MTRAEMDFDAWFKSSRLKLHAADSAQERKDYGNAVSSLQGVEEKAAKAILLRLSFLTDEVP